MKTTRKFELKMLVPDREKIERERCERVINAPLEVVEQHYDDEGDSLFISLRDGEYDESEEICDGFVIDFDKSGRPLNIDIHSNASKIRRHPTSDSE